MNVALLLLLLLAIAAIPGSLVPQRAADPNGVTQYFAEHPKLAPILDAVQMFDVFGSVWFSAIYILLFISLIGCLVPRIRHHWDALRKHPPHTPARLERMPAYVSRVVSSGASGGASSGGAAGDATSDAVFDRARELLKRQRYRIAFDELRGRRSVRAERGYLRETGNILFHVGLVSVLCAVAYGGMTTYDGNRVLVEGETFTNSLAAYDSFNPGRLFNEDSLPAFSLTLDRFRATYEQQDLQAYGQPIDYRANISVGRPGSTRPDVRELRVNHPLLIDNTNVFLLGNGYAPVVTVRDAQGHVVFSDAVAFLPQDANLTSLGIVKVPDTTPRQLGFVGFLYPTAVKLPSGAFSSSYPGLINPRLTFNVYAGDLGINDGLPKSVYALDTDHMQPLAARGASHGPIEMKVGQTATLPEGAGTVTFDGVKRFVSLELRHDNSMGWMLASVLVAVAGLLTSLFVPRRRLWVAVRRREDGTTQVEVAGLARGDDPRLEQVVDAVADELTFIRTTSAKA